jgi:hypothetical protein
VAKLPANHEVRSAAASSFCTPSRQPRAAPVVHTPCLHVGCASRCGMLVGRMGGAGRGGGGAVAAQAFEVRLPAVQFVLLTTPPPNLLVCHFSACRCFSQSRKRRVEWETEEEKLKAVRISLLARLAISLVSSSSYSDVPTPQPRGPQRAPSPFPPKPASLTYPPLNHGWKRLNEWADILCLALIRTLRCGFGLTVRINREYS